MSERRTIGDILTELGRISADDVESALAYQREHGGYFGAALVACGLVTTDEVEWGLASQFDLPYVFPDADAVDPDASTLVSPEWALAHLTLPIMRTEHTLRVVIDSPIRTEPIDELRARTNLEVELALASPDTIRELIRQVYGRATPLDEERRTPIDLTGAFEAVAQTASSRFGISVRGTRSYAWWEDGGTIRRRPLSDDWRSDLDEVMEPGPAGAVGEAPWTKWEAALDLVPGIALTVDACCLSDESGREYLFRPRDAGVPLDSRFPPPEEGIASEIRLLARSGTAHFMVSAEPPEIGRELLPHLPVIFLDPSWRSVHIHGSEQADAAETFSLRLPIDPHGWAPEIEKLRAFGFDVVTVDLDRSTAEWAERALDIASVAFLLWGSADDTRSAHEAGIRWHLRIARGVDEQLKWSLEPLHA